MTDKAAPVGPSPDRRLPQIFKDAEGSIQARGSMIDTKHRRSVDHLGQQLETVWAGGIEVLESEKNLFWLCATKVVVVLIT